MDTVVPSSYAAWRHCIEIHCGIPLERAYIAQRLSALQTMQDFHTQQFVRRWGEAHKQQVIAWFHQAAADAAQDAR